MQQDITISVPGTAGKFGILPIVPAVTVLGPGQKTASYAASYDYTLPFSCDKFGYVNNIADLAWIEMWAADHGMSNYFYCGKLDALAIPATLTKPPYRGLWGHLGEGRSYDLYIRYRIGNGSASQLSGVIATISNSGIGTPGLASNPNPSDVPIITTTMPITPTYVNIGDLAFDVIFNLQLEVVKPGWLRRLLFYLVRGPRGPLGPGPDAQATVHTRVPYSANGTYAIKMRHIPASTEGVVPTYGDGDTYADGVEYGVSYNWDVWMAYEDHNGGISAPTYVLALLAQAPSVSSLLGIISLFQGTGVPTFTANNGAVKGSMYWNTTGSFGGLIYVYDGAAWHVLI